MRLPSSEADNKRAKTENENNPLDAALFAAVRKRQTKECIRLLDLGANVNCTGACNWTPLSEAVDLCEEEIIQALIERGADVNIGEGRANPLFRAIRAKNIKIFRMLLQRGAEVNGHYLSEAASYGQTEMCQILLSEHNQASNSQELDAALRDAATGHLETCIELLKWGANPKARSQYNDDANTPLKSAALYGCTEICTLLIEAGADVNITEEDKKDAREFSSALHVAVKREHFKTAERLLQHGADANALDSSDFSPLDLAEGNTQMSDLLIVFGAIPNSEYLELSRAAQEGDIKKCAELIRRGYNVNAQRGIHKHTPLEFAAAAGHRDICLLLLKHQADPNLQACDDFDSSPLSKAVENGHTEIFQDLIQAGADYKAVYDFEEKSLLHVAAEYGRTKICQILIEQLKIPVDIRTTEGDSWTPLMWAAYYLHTETCSYLIKQGANVNAFNDDMDRCVLVLCCCCDASDDEAHLKRFSDGVYKQICQMLLMNGAKINIPTEEGSVLSELFQVLDKRGKLDREILDMTIPRAVLWKKYNAQTKKVEMLNNPSNEEYNNLCLKVLYALWVLKKWGLAKHKHLGYEILIRAQDLCAAVVTISLNRILKAGKITGLPQQFFKPISDRIYGDTMTSLKDILKNTTHDIEALEAEHGEKIKANIGRSFQLK